MIEYKFDKIGFLQGVFSTTKIFLCLLIFILFFAAVISGDFFRTTIVIIFLASIIIASGLKWNTYFIQQISINDGGIYLLVMKYGNVYIDKLFSNDEVKFDIQVASSSVRNISYKLVIYLKDETISQYPINGWKEQEFRSILNSPYIQAVSKKGK